MSNIKQLRIKQNLTRKEFAKKIGISEVYIGYLETGRRKNPSARIVKKMSEILNVKFEDLFF
ncbi:helix-turn-helix transcriptional regulator [Clostridium sporogenes]|uniref:Helix-turn-helix transcriptional regulator n=1 Tax=Clostridium botulinum TaxID=1491 RepID=A0A6B4GWR2_CLOBO|nr:helix-turn-helix transcriptional regulator [Clostridium botulinum]NFD76910.1 helix-turn-helix transcriptional regulator [Clostridium botulinum]NFD84882.1 helix-turn-helix transcriptional regulator [Clostridium botulinum]NFE09587.1 helix-turn-helix transcriptional regulator [Clostridium botulinum]NFE36033.1 helix-turn-helix transcriptional regulator [Clostridium botulinum]NFE50298.1 helix-turn-helix transcriptional regulator [Clostridium botulinum]